MYANMTNVNKIIKTVFYDLVFNTEAVFEGIPSPDLVDKKVQSRSIYRSLLCTMIFILVN